ncbi:MAG: hypothetical protein ACQCXQ_03030 [Verrucomicrobiales bacterium]
MPRGKTIARAAAAAALTLAAQAGDFIRVRENDDSARLQTAVTRFEKNGATVDLVGAIHIADADYYNDLNTRFQSYDSVLFEMIGGENLNQQPNPAPAAQPAAADAPPEQIDALRKIYQMVSRFLKLTGQAESIDYTADNFVHADLTLAEFEQAQKNRDESVLSFAIKASKDAPKPAKEPDTARLLKAMLTGQSDAIKLEIVHTLGQGDDQIASFAGESVIISDRNQRCMEVLEKQLADGKTNVAIFYGAAHFPDLSARMKTAGYRQTKQEWLTAWDIPKPKAKPDTPEIGEKDAA